MTQHTQDTTAAYMERARVLTSMKRRAVEEIIKSRGGTQMTHVAVQRKAATILGKLAAATKVRAGDARQLVKMYERFEEFEMRAELESLFGIADLQLLATETDEAVKAAIQMKRADMNLTGAAITTRLRNQPPRSRAIRKNK
ncbi:hypothetical protein AWB81_08575 [Caballeronia arationis]|nr:hypothetical protein AWB81_08575 [Caballeronia arationis]